MNDDYFMSLANKLACKAFKKNEVPVGAVIVKNGKVLSTAYNKKNANNKTIDHAEILAITKANKKLNDWRLNGCIMYVSMKPCNMCMGAINEARISRVVYGCDADYKVKSVDCTQISDEVLQNEASDLMKKFFLNRR